MRTTYTSRDVTAGCFDCYGSNGKWFGPNAQGVAARHHDATGHKTWADVYLCVRYGERDEPQDAAPSSAPAESGE